MFYDTAIFVSVIYVPTVGIGVKYKTFISFRSSGKCRYDVSNIKLLLVRDRSTYIVYCEVRLIRNRSYRKNE